MAPNWEIPFEEIELERDPIGRGGYGTVFRGRWRGSIVAVKKMNIDSRMANYRY